MASLVEELVAILEAEAEIYRQLLEYGRQKRQILIDADIPALEALTAEEQDRADILLSYSNKQLRLLKDVANVLGKPEEEMTVTKLIDCLQSQPKEQEQLRTARDRLLETAKETQAQNQQNEVLLRQAIELTEFDMTLLKSLRQAPETANYDRSAYSTGTLLGGGGFDAKQ